MYDFILGYTFKENDYVLFPPNFTRSDTSCPEGCFAIVWWSHKPSWFKGPNINPDNNLISKESNNINEAFIYLLENDDFHSIFLGRDNTTFDINEEFIGVDIDNYNVINENVFFSSLLFLHRVVCSLNLLPSWYCKRNKLYTLFIITVIFN